MFSFCSSSSDKLTRAITADCWGWFLLPGDLGGGGGRRREESQPEIKGSNLVFYAQSTMTVISG